LSSSKPNLQNIPIRDENSSRVREAFVAREGFEFISADYSQIELRLVAHMSDDPMLIEAFKSGDDIHAITASEVFSIMPGLVTPEMRRRAKAINFGIIYGMGAFGLANDLEISVNEASEYIDDYFLHYKLVKKFIDKTIKDALKLGYTRTLFGRKRFIPELKSTSGPTRKFGERIAINSPVQGTAADMIKAAMLKIEERMQAESFRSKMILQVHDELIWEALPDERERLVALVTEEMEGIVKLKVPIKVNIKSGSDWRSVE
jgi:DNA polymerase-1